MLGRAWTGRSVEFSGVATNSTSTLYHGEILSTFSAGYRSVVLDILLWLPKPSCDSVTQRIMYVAGIVCTSRSQDGAYRACCGSLRVCRAAPWQSLAILVFPRPLLPYTVDTLACSQCIELCTTINCFVANILSSALNPPFLFNVPSRSTFLASDDAAMVTSSVYRMDGGWSIKA